MDNYHYLRTHSSEKEKALWEKARQFEEELFSDLTMKEYKQELGAEFTVDTETIKGWLFKIDSVVKGDQHCCGSCSPEKIIVIDPKYIDDDDTLIHELIHAYEYMLTEHYRQYVVLRLYQKLLKEIPDLLNIINNDMFKLIQKHTLFFMLKSYDLDLRFNKPLGTIYKPPINFL